MRTHTLMPCQTKQALFLVTAYHCGEVQGLLLHPRLAQAQPIQSLPQMLLLLDGLLDLEHCPQPPAPLAPPLPEALSPLAEFQIQVLFREYHSWQGRLVHLETGQEAPFRSVLELIQLLDDVLSED